MAEVDAEFLKMILQRRMPDDEAESISRDVARQLEPEAEKRALEQGIGSQDYYAYLWSDLLNMDLVLDMLSGSVKGKAQIAAVNALLKFWLRLRKIRVKLDEPEAKVLLAVRRAGQTGMTLEELQDSLEGQVEKSEVPIIARKLTKRKYRDDIFVLKETRGRYTTPF